MRKTIEKLLRELKEELGIKEEVKVRLKRFKLKVASVSLTGKVIYLPELRTYKESYRRRA